MRATTKKNERRIIIAITILYCIIVTGIVIAMMLTRTQELSKINLSKQETNQYKEGDEDFEETEDVKFLAGFESHQENNEQQEYENIRYYYEDEIGSQETFSFDIMVSNGGLLIDPKIEIDSKNFFLQTNFPEDEIFKGNYISVNTKEIELKNIDSQSEDKHIEFSGMVRSGDYSNENRKMDALNNSVANYERSDNKIIFTAVYKNRDGEEIDLRKEIPLYVFWKAKVDSYIDNTEQKYYEVDTRVDQNEKTIELSFEIRNEEPYKELLLENTRVDAYIPKLNNFSPISVKTDAEVDVNYNPDRAMLTLRNWATIDENGTITREVPRDFTYTINVKYPLEAYENIDKNIFKLEIPTRVLYNVPTNIEDYNLFYDRYGFYFFIPFDYVWQQENNYPPDYYPVYGEQILDIYAQHRGGYGIVRAVYEKTFIEELGTQLTLGNRIQTPEGLKYVIPKQAIALMMGENAETLKKLKDFMSYPIFDLTESINGNGKYSVKYDIQASQIGVDKVEIIEKENNYIKKDHSKVAVGESVKSKGIWFDIEEEKIGITSIDVFDKSTGGLIETFSGSELIQYSEYNPYFFPRDIDSIKIEVRNLTSNALLRIGNYKSFLTEIIPTIFTEEEIKEFNKIESIADISINNGEAQEKSNEANYEDWYSGASISIDSGVVKVSNNDNKETIRIAVGKPTNNMMDNFNELVQKYIFRKYGPQYNTTELSEKIILAFHKNGEAISVYEIENILAEIENKEEDFSSQAEMLANMILEKVNSLDDLSDELMQEELENYLIDDLYFYGSPKVMELIASLAQERTMQKDELINNYLIEIIKENYYQHDATTIQENINDIRERTYEDNIDNQLAEAITAFIDENKTPWINGSFLIKFPEEIQDVEINRIETNNSLVEIDGYEKLIKDGCVVIRIATTNYIPIPGFGIDIDANITTKLGATDTTKDIELYAKNQMVGLYYNESEDIYDTDANKNTEEIVNKEETQIRIKTNDYIITRTNVEEKDKVTIETVNNFEIEAEDISILGRIPFIGNKTVKSQYDLDTGIDIPMTEDGIEVPEDLAEYTKVYYSENGEATKDLDDEANGWTERPENWNRIKSYLIRVEGKGIEQRAPKKFSYRLNIPDNMGKDSLAYVNHAIYYKYELDEGSYYGCEESNIGQIKAIQNTANLKIITTQKGKDLRVDSTRYQLVSTDESKTLKVESGNENGELTFEGLIEGKTYKLKQLETNEEFEPIRDVIYFSFNKTDGQIVLNADSEYVVSSNVLEDTITINIENTKYGKLIVEGLGNKPKEIEVYEMDDERYTNYHLYTMSEDSYEFNKIPTNRPLSLYVYQREYNYNLGVEIGAEEGVPKIEFSDYGKVEDYSAEEINGIIVGRIKIKPTEFDKEKIEITKVVKQEVVINNDTVEEQEVPIQGAEFELYSQNYNRFLGKYVSDENGKIIIDNMYYNERCTLTETKAPEGYALMEPLTFNYYKTGNGQGGNKPALYGVEEYTINDEGTICFNIIDKELVNYKIIKKDKETNQPLPGTKFIILNARTLKPVTDGLGNVLGTEETINGKNYYTFTTDQNGEINVVLSKDLYRVEEIETLEKYDANNCYGYVGKNGEASKVLINRQFKDYKNIWGGGYVNNIISTQDGGYMVSINTNDSFRTDEVTLLTGNTDGDKAVLIKYDRNNNVEWARGYLGKYHSVSDQLIQSRDGGYILTIGELLLKVNQYGIEEWKTSVPINTYMLKGLIETKDGGILLSFEAQRLSIEGKETANPDGNIELLDTFLIKYDKNGNFTWYKQFGGSGNDTVLNTMEIENGNIILSAALYTSNLYINEDINESSLGNRSTVSANIILDHNGNLLEFQEIPTNSIAGYPNIIKTQDGGFLEYGKGFGSINAIDGTVFSMESGTSIPFFIKYDKNFNAEWFKKINSKYASIEKVIELKNGNYLIKATNTSDSIALEDDVIFPNNGKSYLELSSDGTFTRSVQISSSTTPDTKPDCEIRPGVILAVFENGSVESSRRVALLTFRDSNDESESIELYNKKKTFNIKTYRKSSSLGEGGIISGQNDNIYEEVRYGESNTKEIIITPYSNFKIDKIEINGKEIEFTPEDDGSYRLPTLNNITEDKTIVVSFAEIEHWLTINKVDDRTGEPVEGAELQIEQQDIRPEIQNPVEDLEPNNIVNKLLHEEIGAETVKYDEITASNPDYYFVLEDGYYTPTNSATYQNEHGGDGGISNSVAASYIPIDLTGYEGKYKINPIFEISSEKGYDWFRYTVSESPDIGDYSTNGRSGNWASSGNYYVSIQNITDLYIQGGKVYYFHFKYEKDEAVDVGKDWARLKEIRLYRETDEIFNLKTTEKGEIISTNGLMENAYGESYLPIDLTTGSGVYELSFEVDRKSSAAMLNANLTESDAPTKGNNNGNIAKLESAYTMNQTIRKKLIGGKKYYLHFVIFNGRIQDEPDGYVIIKNVKVEKDRTMPMTPIKVKTDENGKALVNIPYGQYIIKETKAPEGYALSKTETDFELSEFGTREVTLENERLKKVTVHHYEKGTTNEIAPSEEYYGIRNTTYKTYSTLENPQYELEKDTAGKYILPLNRAGVYPDDEDIEVNYYYVKKGLEVVVHHFIEGTSIPVPLENGTYAQDQIIPGELGDTYETSPLPEDQVSKKYELYRIPDNQNGVFDEDFISVNYYYKRAFEDLTINKYDEETGEPIKDAVFDVRYGRYRLIDEYDEFINNGPLYPEEDITLFDKADISIEFVREEDTQSFAQIGEKYYAENTDYFNYLMGTNHINKDIARAYFIIDLSRVTGMYALKINAEGVIPTRYNEGLLYGRLENDRIIKTNYMSSVGNYGYYNGFSAYIVEEGDSSTERTIFNMTETTDAKDYLVSMEGGKIYYVPIAYARNYKGILDFYLQEDSNINNEVFTMKTRSPLNQMDAAIINSIEVYGADVTKRNRKYYFEKNDKNQYVSNNQMIDNTTAVTTVPIDLTGFDGEKFTLKVNAEIFNSGFNGTGMIVVSQRENEPFTYNPLISVNAINDQGAAESVITEEPYRFRDDVRVMGILRGKIDAKDYTLELDGGKVYFMHWYYDKPISIYWDSGDIPKGGGANLGKTAPKDYSIEKAAYSNNLTSSKLGQEKPQDGALDALVINDISIETQIYKRLRTNENGKATTKVPIGVISIQEVDVPEDYVLNSDIIEKEITKDENQVDVGNRKKKAQVKVRHLIKGTNDRVPSNVEGEVVQDEIKNGKPGQIYATKPATNIPREYVLEGAATPTSGEYTDEPKEVIYYYKSIASKVTIHHLLDPEEAGGNIIYVAKDDEVTGIIGDPYKSYPIAKAEGEDEPGDPPTKYILVRVVGEPEGELGEEESEVTYYYKTKDSSVTFKYLEMGINGEEDRPIEGITDETQTGKVDSPYRCDPKTIEGYGFVRTVGENEGTLTIEPKVVIFYYLPKTSVTVRYIDTDTKEVIDEREVLYGSEDLTDVDEFVDSTETIDGLYGDNYKDKIKIKAFKNYVLEVRPENLPNTMEREPLTITYEYKKVTGGVIERHIDINAEPPYNVIYEESHQGAPGEEYNIPSGEFDGYILMDKNDPSIPAKEPIVVSGEYTDVTTDVVFYYAKEAEVIIRYIDKNSREELTKEPDIIYGYEKKPYDTTYREFEGYILDKPPSNRSGNMTAEPIEVIYEYLKTSGGIVINYVDDLDHTHQLLDEEREPGNIGDKFTLKEKEIPGYELVREKNPESMTIEFTEDTQYITFYYRKKVDITVKYIDKATGEEIKIYDENQDKEIDLTEKISSYKGERYKTEEKDIPGYDLLEEPENKEGELGEEDVEVIYYYSKKVKIIVRYLDEEDKAPIREETVIDNVHEGEEYTTKPETVEYYTLLDDKKPNNSEGKVNPEDVNENGELYVDYIYRKKVFNLRVDKIIKQTNVKGLVNIYNDSIAKIELNRKTLSTQKLEITYEITVKNDQEIAGACQIIESIPMGFTADIMKNPLWNIENQKASMEIALEPGESRTIPIVLDWAPTEGDLGTKINTVRLEDVSNKAGFTEKTTQDNSSSADLIVSVSTGAETNNILESIALTLLVVSMGVCIYYLRKKE